MSGLTAFLQTELLTLSSEARRKHPEIKEASERLSAILRSFKERPGHNIANELSKSEDALRPFILACETKQVKLVTIAIGCIQKLISFHAIPETSVRTILRKLTDISVHGVEIQLKILQTVLPLLTNYRSVHDDILAEALLICFRLQDSKIVVVNNTAAATLRQLVIFVFDKVAKEDAQQPAEDEGKHEIQLNSGEKMELRPCAKDAYYLFQDLCLLTNGEQPEFLRLSHLSKTFGLELIESVLTNHYNLFRTHKELSSLLRETVCPLIIRNFSEKNEFPQTMRLTRVVYILIKQFSEILIMECEIFLSMFVKTLEPENPQWQRVLAMEIFRGVCTDPLLLCAIFNWYDHAGNTAEVFRDMITAFGRLATEKPQLIGATQGGRDSLDHAAGSTTYSLSMSSSTAFNANESNGVSLGASTSTMRIQCIDQLDKAEPPPIPDTYIYYLAAVCLNSVADGLAGLVLPRFAAGSNKSFSSTTNRSTSTSNAETSSTEKAKEETTDTAAKLKKDMTLVTDMANVAWPGLLAAMSFYLSANLDEELFQCTMRSYQNFTNVCGVLDLVVPRDAFLTNLCKNSVAASSALSSGLLSSKSASSSTSLATVSTTTAALSYMELPAQQQQMLSNIQFSDKNLYSLRVLLNIAMYLGGVLGSSWYLVLETLQHAEFLLLNRPTPKGAAGATGVAQSVHNLRRTLSNSTSIQTSPNLPGSPGQSSPNANVDVDHVSIIQASMNRLFENTKYLEDKAFISFATALCQLSAEISGLPFGDDQNVSSSSGKASRMKVFHVKSFAVDKLHYIAILNMDRLLNSEKDIGGWDLILSHLIATANYPQTPSSIRTQCCETIADIIITAMDHSLAENKETDEEFQIRLLTALNRCINYSSSKEETDHGKTYPEVQRMGLETLNKLLQTSGHSFTSGWSHIFDMIKHVTADQSHQGGDFTDDLEEEKSIEDEARTERSSLETTSSSLLTVTNQSTIMHGSKGASGLIKVAFAGLQLICTDFLSLLSPDCLRQCISALGAFGNQSEDLNISLTAIGLLWNLSDFIQTKRMDILKQTGGDKDEAIEKESLKIDRVLGAEETTKTLCILWMLLLLQLSHLCTDRRPEVRNGANQTLFRTIMMNGNELEAHLWNACIWDVLFPLLDGIKMSSIRAVKIMHAQLAKSPPAVGSTDRDASGFMLHHSRDTADKQWDETKVLVLTGISNIFHDFLEKLSKLPRFESAWMLLLAHLEDSCLRPSQEVSLASMKSFKTISTPPAEKNIPELHKLWKEAWSSWLVIGQAAVNPPANTNDIPGERSKNLNAEFQSLTLSLSSSSAAPILTDFSQEMLTVYVNTFTDLYSVISCDFSLSDIQSLLRVLRDVLVYPTSPQYRPDIDSLSPLQEAVLKVISTLDMDAPDVPPLVLKDLAEYMTLAFLSPTDANDKSKNASSKQRRYSTVTYIALNKTCSKIVADLFKAHADNVALYSEGVFERIIAGYGIPMKLKYDCPPSYKHGDDKTPLWKMATSSLLDILLLGLEKVHNFDKEIPQDRFEGIWRTLVDILEGSLLSPSTPPSSMSIEELDVDEHFDISVLSVIQSDIIIYLGQPRVPEELIQKLVHVIHESSRLYYVDESSSHRRDGETAEEVATKELAIEDETRYSNDRSSDILGTTGTIVPVMKESFAYAALKALFTLCSAEKQDHPDVRRRIACATAPYLLERCDTILRNYTADEPLLGRCPFPRVRKDEMLFLLQQSIELKLRENILPIKPEDEGSTKQQLLSGQRGHLFHLYPALCTMITCKDEVVVGLIRECLLVAGSEVGLGPDPRAKR